MNRAALGVTIAATAVILLATLIPDHARGMEEWANCILCGERGVSDALVNLALFLPLGVGLSMLGVRLRHVLLAGALLSATVELAQLAIPGRDSSVGDVLFNTLGTGAGAAVVAWMPRAAMLPDLPAAWLSLLAAAASSAVIAATGALLAPSFPHARYWGLWTPNLAHLEWYRGRVRAASVGGILIGPGPVAQSAEVRAALLAGDTVAVTAVAGPEIPALGSLFGINDLGDREILLVGPERDDLVYRFRMGAVLLTLDRPEMRLRGALRRLRPGDPLTVRIWRRSPGNTCISVNGRPTCGLGFSAGAGWRLVHNVSGVSRWAGRGLEGLWTGLLFLPLGFLVRRRWPSALAIGGGLVALVAVPHTVGLQPTPAWLLVAATAAVLMGRLCRERLAHSAAAIRRAGST